MQKTILMTKGKMYYSLFLMLGFTLLILSAAASNWDPATFFVAGNLCTSVFVP